MSALRLMELRKLQKSSSDYSYNSDIVIILILNYNFLVHLNLVW